MPTHVNRATADRLLDRLRGDQGDLPVVPGEVELPPEPFTDLRERCEGGFTGSAYAWVVREPADAPPVAGALPDDAGLDREHVLLVVGREAEEATWGLPGGGRESGESYAEAAAREVREEAGVDAAIGSPFLAHRVRHRPADGGDAVDAVVLHTLWVCFDATYDGGHLEVQPDEVRGAAWFADPPPRLGPWAQYRAREWWTGYEADDPWWDVEG